MSKRRFKRGYSLLELVVAFAILASISSALIWKMFAIVEQKRFSSQAEQLYARLRFIQSLAIYMQSDWKGVFDNGSFSVYCVEDPAAIAAPRLVLDALALGLNGQREPRIVFEFSASGDLSPKGLLEIYSNKGTVLRWTLPTLEKNL